MAYAQATSFATISPTRHFQPQVQSLSPQPPSSSFFPPPILTNSILAPAQGSSSASPTRSPEDAIHAPAPTNPYSPSQLLEPDAYLPQTRSPTFVCEWRGCRHVYQSLEQLFLHITNDHVGRKATNNLCLECRWGDCSVKVHKRDHMTSHLRVHVPVKPHHCPICGKAFKRLQDLKKHGKTHTGEVRRRAEPVPLIITQEPSREGARPMSASYASAHQTPQLHSNTYVALPPSPCEVSIHAAGDHLPVSSPNTSYPVAVTTETVGVGAHDKRMGMLGASLQVPSTSSSPGTLSPDDSASIFPSPIPTPTPGVVTPAIAISPCSVTTPIAHQKRPHPAMDTGAISSTVPMVSQPDPLHTFFHDIKRQKLGPVYDTSMVARITDIQDIVHQLSPERLLGMTSGEEELDEIDRFLADLHDTIVAEMGAVGFCNGRHQCEDLLRSFQQPPEQAPPNSVAVGGPIEQLSEIPTMASTSPSASDSCSAYGTPIRVRAEAKSRLRVKAPASHRQEIPSEGRGVGFFGKARAGQHQDRVAAVTQGLERVELGRGRKVRGEDKSPGRAFEKGYSERKQHEKCILVLRGLVEEVRRSRRSRGGGCAVGSTSNSPLRNRC